MHSVGYSDGRLCPDKPQDMPDRNPERLKQHTLAAFLFLLALVTTWFAYAPGISGGLHFDDPPNLSGLAQVSNAESAINFIVSGHAGPLGRPLALATFVPEAHAWPDAPGVFLRTNILIHLLNGTLVCWFLYLLGLARGSEDRHAAFAAIGAAAIWMLMPILASTSLFIVQRMTTLSATFVLLGAIGYFYARRYAGKYPLVALAFMSLALGLGAGLGALSKESGVLLFLFALVMEATLLDRPTGIPKTLWRTWFTIALVVPPLMLGWYLVSVLPYSEGIILRRGFTGFERLITQAEILWQYLFLAFLPSPPRLGPYHDSYRLLTSLSQPAALLSVLGWGLTILAAALARRRAPLFTFAVTWFLCGHLIESTTVSLELYYEHRNYLPLIGPAYALVASALSVSRQWRPKIVGLLGIYSLLLAGLLFSVTSLSGNPALAAEMWQIYNPDSLRATQRLARQNENTGDPWTALRFLRGYLERHPEATYVGVSILQISCQVEPDKNHGVVVEQLKYDLRDAPYSHSTFGAISGLYGLIQSGSCAQVDSDGIYMMAQGLLENPRYNIPIVRHNLHVLMARIGMERADLGLTMHHMEEALARHPDINTITLAVGLLNSAGLQEKSLELLNDAAQWRPRHPVRAAQWDKRVNLLQQISSS